ncbi:hypothetical protein SAMN05443575_2523 [Jatrophihabitans endophyticus]|uniref:Uncharacterized protein n=1 Tax=Jatrophihabitans endophyticus TaxID=1206085 RepID=A0A1M5LR12_9ACTN|nr:hypothetical protein [Jatrophihabitans endophyticus]SHG67554.1 hypothetical protein SAMN05443575_2523 [Jatrophihabitans endophyticus]
MKRRAALGAAALLVPLALAAPAAPTAAASAAAGAAAGVAAAQVFTPGGSPITGGDDAGAAAPLTPGRHVDTLARGTDDVTGSGSVRYYAITLRRGETPYVAATIAPGPTVRPGSERLGVEVSLRAPGDDQDCAQDEQGDDAIDDRLAEVTAVATPDDATGREDGCPAGTVVVKVARSGPYALADPLRVELAYRLEPAVDATGQPGAAATAAPVRPGLAGRPTVLRSGAGFDTAPLVPTGIYRDSLAAGDVRIVRVRLGWGQRLAFSLTAPARAGVEYADALDVELTVRNPVRAAVDASGTGSATTSVGYADAALAGSTPAPVRYANRASDDDGVVGCAVAGDWFLELAVDRPEDGTGGARFPYTLQVQVVGQAQRGPGYLPTGGATASASPRAERGGGVTAHGVLVAGVAGVGAGLVAVVLLVLLLRRRRAHQARAHT